MIDQLMPGELVVAKGKLARVQQVFSAKHIRVILNASREALMVARRDIERIGSEGSASEKIGIDLDVNDFTVEELSLAAERFNVIRQWKADNIDTGQACVKLNLSRSYFFQLARTYDEDLGPLSLVLRRRGIKKGATRLDEAVEVIIFEAAKTYESRAASFSKVWVEVDVACKEQGLPSPCKDTVLRRVQSILSEKKRFQIKHGRDAAAQKYSARPGKHVAERPLQLVQMDHTLVDVILLADDRVSVIGRPWWTVAIDQSTKVILGYYLSLHVPSAVSVACALSQSVLPKAVFAKSVGLDPADYPYYGKPEVLHMDNAAEFTSQKFKAGCTAFGIDPVYRPLGEKHYGGHVERLIGTFMTTKVHFLKGATMSNAVARRSLNSETNATMTFSDFVRWFAREVVVYHSTVHSELKISPRQAWADYFAPNGGVPYPPKVSDPEQLKLWFMPQESRKVNPDGIKLHGQTYWDPVLAPFVGTADAIVKYDPFNMGEIWVKLGGQFCPVRLSDLTQQAPSYEEYRASRLHRRPVRAGAIDDDCGIKAYREKQEIEKKSAALTRTERRRNSAQKEYLDAYPPHVTGQSSIKPGLVKPDYSVSPKRFRAEDKNE
jgi:putative transposase